MASRLDPYWDGVWDAQGGVSWHGNDDARRQAAAGLTSIPKALDMPREVALRRFIEDPDLTSRLAVLGAVHSFRILTVQQLAYLLDDRRLLATTNNALSVLWACGLIDLGRFTTSIRAGSLLGRDALVRPARGSVFEGWIKDLLTWPEWQGVTGGQPWVAPAARDQHDLLATEIALRLVEHAPIGTVFGERFSTIDLLAGSGIGYSAIVGDNTAADLTLVRRDGLRIAIEVTRTTGARHEAKVAKWARMLEDRPLETSGLCVVFVVARDEAWGPTQRAVEKAIRSHPGPFHDRVSERIGMVAIEDWHPSRREISEAGRRMRVLRPLRPVRDPLDPDRPRIAWESCDLLDMNQRPFVPADPDAMRAVVPGSLHLWQTPVALRERIAAEHGRPDGLAGLLGGGAQPPAPQAGLALPVGAARGVSGAAKPPQRLRGAAG